MDAVFKGKVDSVLAPAGLSLTYFTRLFLLCSFTLSSASIPLPRAYVEIPYRERAW